MSESTAPHLSSLIDRLRTEDASPVGRSAADDRAVLVLDSTAIVEPAPAGSTDRRAFLARASLLSAAIPGVGAALAASGRTSSDWRAHAEPMRATPDAGAIRSYTKEFSIVQSECYLADAVQGVRVVDGTPIRVRVGDCVRFRAVSVGSAHVPAVHEVCEQADSMSFGALRRGFSGVQTFTVPAGGGMVFELVCDVPGEFPFVNHGFGHGQKGAIGILVVEP